MMVITYDYLKNIIDSDKHSLLEKCFDHKTRFSSEATKELIVRCDSMKFFNKYYVDIGSYLKTEDLFDIDDKVLVYASCTKNYEFLDRAIAKKIKIPEQVVSELIINDSLEQLNLVVENGCKLERKHALDACYYLS